MSTPKLFVSRAIVLLFLLALSSDQLTAQPNDLFPKTDVFAIFSLPKDSRVWPALDSLGVGWVRLQNQMGEIDLQTATASLSAVLNKGYALWLTLHHRDRTNVADTLLFDLSERGSFPPVDHEQYKQLVRAHVQPLVGLLQAQGKDPSRWLVVQFCNEVVPNDVRPDNSKRFWHGSSDSFLETLSLTNDSVKEVDSNIPVAFGGISSVTLETILEYTRTGDENLRKIAEWNERLLLEGTYDWADIHLYHAVESIPDKVAWVRLHWNGPLASSEIAGPDERTGVVYSEDLQAQELPVRLRTALDARIDRIFWAFLRDLDIPGDRLAQTLGLIASNWRNKPAYFKYQQLITSTVTNVEEHSPPAAFQLSQNYPNPFNPSTTIRFSLPQKERVVLEVFDVLGREVATLLDDELPSGEHSLVFDAKNLTSGVYFYRITSGSEVRTRKLLLLQ